MDRYREARRHRKKESRPHGRVARGLSSFVNAVFFCIWTNPSVNDEEPYLPNVQEPRREETKRKTKCFPWTRTSKKKNHKEKMNIEILRETGVHVDGLGLPVKDSLPRSNVHKSASTQSPVSFSSQLSIRDIDCALSRSTNSVSSIAASSHWTISSLQSSLRSTSVSSFTSSLASKDTDKADRASLSSFKWGILPTSSISSFDVNSTDSDSDKEVEHRKDVVPGGTIPDVYALINRTLNLGMPTKAVTKATPSSSTEECNVPCDSLHKLHTEWLPNDHENVEVFLGLKEKNSMESTLPDATEQQQVVKMDDVPTVDSGIASNAASTNPSEMMTQS